MSVHELFAYLCVRDAAAAMEFHARAFGGREKFRLTEPGGRIGHAEVEIGPATLMLSEEYPEYGIVGPAADAFYGERGGVVRDPFGHRWNIGHSIEKVEPEEMQRRYDALMKSGGEA